jgi:hypothetical protein
MLPKGNPRPVVVTKEGAVHGLKRGVEEVRKAVEERKRGQLTRNGQMKRKSSAVELVFSLLV